MKCIPWIQENGEVVWQWCASDVSHDKHLFNYPFTTQSQHLKTMLKKAFENIMRKGENAGDYHFLPF